MPAELPLGCQLDANFVKSPGRPKLIRRSSRLQTVADIDAKQQIPSASAAEQYQDYERATQRSESQLAENVQRRSREDLQRLQQAVGIQEAVVFFGLFPRGHFGAKKVRRHRLEHSLRMDEL